MKRRVVYGLLLVLAVAVPLLALADPSKGHGKDHHSKGRLFLVMRMVDELGLSDEKALAVSAALKQAEEKREELGNKRRELAKQIRESLDAKKPDDAALGKLIDQSIELDRQHAKAKEDSFASVRKILTVQEQAKLVLMRIKMRHGMGDKGGFHHGGGRPHGGPHHGECPHMKGGHEGGHGAPGGDET